EVREPSAVPQRDAARGRHSAIAGDLAPKGVRRFVSTCYVLEGPRSLRRRRQGDQTRQTALEAVAWTAGRHTGRASVGCFEPADRHGGEHEGAPRRRGWRGKPDRRLVVENGRGRARQAVGGGIGSALLQPELSAPGSGGGWSFPHPLLFQYLFRPRPGPASSGAPRCTRPANRAGVGTFGQVRGTSGALRAPDHLASGRWRGDQRDHGPVGRGYVSRRGSAGDVPREMGYREDFPPNHGRIFAPESDRLFAPGRAVPLVLLPALVQHVAGPAHPLGIPPEVRGGEDLQREAVL